MWCLNKRTFRKVQIVLPGTALLLLVRPQTGYPSVYVYSAQVLPCCSQTLLLLAETYKIVIYIV